MRATVLPFLVLSASLAAQQGTVPKGYLTQEGTAASSVLGVAKTDHAFWTIVDATNPGPARQLKGLALRRDGEALTNLAYVARSVTVVVRLAHADFGKVPNADLVSDQVWRKTAWVTVLDKPIGLPALVAKPATPPAAWSISLPLTAPWTYNGTDALAVQIRTTGNNLAQTQTPYPLDAMSTTSYSQGVGQPIGTGCTVTGQSAPLGHSSLLDNFGYPGLGRWQLTVNQAPPSTPALVLIGTSNPDLAFGACAKLFVLPQIVLATGPTNASGYVNLPLQFASSPAYVGLELYSQAAILDAAQPGVPFALTGGRKVAFPAAPSMPSYAGGVGTSAGAGWPGIYRLTKGLALVVGFSW